MRRVYLFDVDGALWDGAWVVANSQNEALGEKWENEALAVGDMHSLMGHTIDEIAMRISPGTDPEEQRGIMKVCTHHETNYLESCSGYFHPGVLKTLRALHESGKELYIVSNCQEGYIEPLFEAGSLNSGEDSMTRGFICYGGTECPKGEDIGLVLERNDLGPEEATYIGDTETDQAAAAGAGVDFYHMRYDFGRVHGALRELDSLEEFLED